MDPAGGIGIRSPILRVVAREALDLQVRMFRKTVQQIGDRRVVFNGKPMDHGKTSGLHWNFPSEATNFAVIETCRRRITWICSMELIKAIIADCLSPMVICLLLQFIGWLAWWKQKKRLGLTLIAVGTLVLSIGGLSGLTHESRRAMEYSFTPVDTATVDSAQPSLIVVLGTGFNDDPNMPANSQVSGTFLSRIIEGVRIYRRSPNARLLISVAGEADEESKVAFLSGMVAMLRLDSDRVSLIATAESTADEAQLVADQFDSGQLFLVTSAGHMQRAMTVFVDAKLTPTAAPAAYQFARTGTSSQQGWRHWVPSTAGVNGNQQWMYEKVALLWHNVSGG